MRLESDSQVLPSMGIVLQNSNEIQHLILVHSMSGFTFRTKAIVCIPICVTEPPTTREFMYFVMPHLFTGLSIDTGSANSWFTDGRVAVGGFDCCRNA